MPPRHARIAAAVVAALILVPVVASAAVRAVGGKDVRPPIAGVFYLPQSFPCDEPVQELELTAGLQQTFADSTFGESVVDGYACVPSWPETGPEHVYVLTATEDLILDLWLTDNEPDLDLILLSECDTDSCLAQDNSQISATLTAGTTVYLLVDGFDGAAGAYELILETRAIGVPEAACDGATAVDILDAAGQVLSGDLYDRPNLVSIFPECSPHAIVGGEDWYALTGSLAEVTITASTAYSELDLVLWLFAGCGPDPVCLDFVDATADGAEEILTWSFPDLESETVYLAVDCFRPGVEDLADYDLVLDVAPRGLPAAACDGATAVDILAASVQEFDGDLFDSPNLVSVYDCASPGSVGGEDWYALAVAPADTDTVATGWGSMLQVTITAATDHEEVDLALWLFDGCGVDATCLGFANTTTGGDEESLILNNPAPETATVYLAVDCLQPAAQDTASYHLILDAVVPIRQRSVTNVRNLFR